MTDEEFKALYAEAFSLKKAKKYTEARRCLTRLATERPGYAPVHGVLASVLFELSEFTEAAKEFRTTARLSPRSELASLGLFHSLMELGDRAAAVAELKRFMNLRQSPEYDLLLSELRTEMGEEKYAAFIGEKDHAKT